MTTTSKWQGPIREERSEGSPEQTCELMNKNIISRRRLEASQHKMTKPGDLTATVNDAVVQGKFMFLSGEICLTCDRQFSSKALDDKALALWTPSAKESEMMETDSADAGNRMSDQTEVSRGHSSLMPTVMGRTRRTRKAAPTEHSE